MRTPTTSTKAEPTVWDLMAAPASNTCKLRMIAPGEPELVEIAPGPHLTDGDPSRSEPPTEAQVEAERTQA